MHVNKLVSASALFFLSLFVFSNANAEYYVVCTVPHYVYVKSHAACHVKRHRVHHVKHYCPKRHHYHRYVRPRSHAEISVYYIYNAFPMPACSCDTTCTSCTPCSYCGSHSDINYVPKSRAYMLDDYDNNDFDLDRRTADDVGSDLNIDY